MFSLKPGFRIFASLACGLLLLFPGCRSGNPQIYTEIDSGRPLMVVKISGSEKQQVIKKNFIHILRTSPLKYERMSLIGLYDLSQFGGRKKKHSSRMNRQDIEKMIFGGRRIWGGVYSVFNKSGEPELWSYSKRHKDRFFDRRSGLKQAGSWEIDRGRWKLLFLYRSKKLVRDFSSAVERYSHMKKTGYRKISVFIFNDKIECRRFACLDNRDFLMRTIAISPVHAESFLRPKESKAGFCIFRLENAGDTEITSWKFH